jgi:hypothetical protein
MKQIGNTFEIPHGYTHVGLKLRQKLALALANSGYELRVDDNYRGLIIEYFDPAHPDKCDFTKPQVVGKIEANEVTTRNLHLEHFLGTTLKELNFTENHLRNMGIENTEEAA